MYELTCKKFISKGGSIFEKLQEIQGDYTHTWRMKIHIGSN